MNSLVFHIYCIDSQRQYIYYQTLICCQGFPPYRITEHMRKSTHFPRTDGTIPFAFGQAESPTSVPSMPGLYERIHTQQIRAHHVGGESDGGGLNKRFYMSGVFFNGLFFVTPPPFVKLFKKNYYNSKYWGFFVGNRLLCGVCDSKIDEIVMIGLSAITPYRPLGSIEMKC